MFKPFKISLASLVLPADIFLNCSPRPYIPFTSRGSNTEPGQETEHLPNGDDFLLFTIDCCTSCHVLSRNTRAADRTKTMRKLLEVSLFFLETSFVPAKIALIVVEGNATEPVFTWRLDISDNLLGVTNAFKTSNIFLSPFQKIPAKVNFNNSNTAQIYDSQFVVSPSTYDKHQIPRWRGNSRKKTKAHKIFPQ